MKKIYITVGVPGCGKSSFFHKSEWIPYSKSIVYVSSDAIRAELFDDEAYQSCSDEVFSIVKMRTELALHRGNSVYVDATNIRKDWRQWAIDLGKQYDARVVGIVFDVPYYIAVLRDKARTRTVGWWVLFKYKFLKYQKPTLEEGFDALLYVDKDGYITSQKEK